jgi:hypothetical protein
VPTNRFLSRLRIGNR